MNRLSNLKGIELSLFKSRPWRVFVTNNDGDAHRRSSSILSDDNCEEGLRHRRKSMLLPEEKTLIIEILNDKNHRKTPR